MQKSWEKENELKGIKVGESYTGKIMNIMPYGIFVHLLPDFEGLLELSDKTLKEFKEGDIIEVKLMGIINKTGKLSLE